MTVNNTQSSTSTGISTSFSPKEAKSARQTFLDYMEMSTGEKMRAAILGEMGYTEEQLKALPPKEREKIEQEIRDRIKEKMERAAKGL